MRKKRLPDKNGRIQTSIRVDATLWNQIDRASGVLGRDKGELVEDAVRHWLTVNRESLKKAYADAAAMLEPPAKRKAG